MSALRNPGDGLELWVCVICLQLALEKPIHHFDSEGAKPHQHNTPGEPSPPEAQGLEMGFHCLCTECSFPPVRKGNFCASYDCLFFSWHISHWHLSAHLGNEVNKEVDQISCLWVEGHKISTVFQKWLIMVMEGLIPPKLVMLSSFFFNK